MNAASEGRVKGSGGLYRIHKWLPEGDYLVQGCMTGSAIEPGLLIQERPSAKHPVCPACFAEGIKEARK